MKHGAHAHDLPAWREAIQQRYPSASFSTRYINSTKEVTQAEALIHKHGQQYTVAKWTPAAGHKEGAKGVILVATTNVRYHTATRGHNRPMRHALVHWLTSLPHPTRPAHTSGYDQGQVGWCLHVVFNADRNPRAKALCGMRPAHGWGLDLYIDTPCTRCLAAAIKRNLTLPTLP